MELEIIRWLRNRLPQSARVLLGPGDDAAIIDWREPTALLLACDTIVEGLDFEFDTSTAEQVGRKALAINLSDLAAMAARPIAATVSFVLPATEPLSLCQQLTEGMLTLADRFSIDLVGGDVSIWEGPLVITVNVAGQPGPAATWRRDGASAGDNLLVTGRLGGSILGHHLDFLPRVEESLLLSSKYAINAAIDISDGLAIDTHRLATESSLGAVLDLAEIPISDAALTLDDGGPNSLTALERALQDGEDFELLLAVDSEETKAILSDDALTFPITLIGTLVEEQGLWSRDTAGRLDRLPATGYVHGVRS